MMKEIYRKPGFKGLIYLSAEDNLITEWSTLDQLNEFDGRLRQLRLAGNPIFKSAKTVEEIAANKLLAVGRIEFLKRYNGGVINEIERRDAELYYMKNSYQVFVNTFKIDDKLMTIDHP